MAKPAPPVEFVTMVRGVHGEPLPGVAVSFSIEILDSPLSETPVYSETQSVTTDDAGYVRLLAGTGEPAGTPYEAVNWSTTRYLRATALPEGATLPLVIGPMSLPEVPLALHAARCNTLTMPAPGGGTMQLAVDNDGTLRWNLPDGPDEPGDPAYDPKLVPERLYIVGTFNNWTVTEAPEMTRLSPTRFTHTMTLAPGTVFKFTGERSWNGDRDWSGTSCDVGRPNPMREFGDTPAFQSTEGTYEITVDFHSYTLTLTRK